MSPTQQSESTDIDSDDQDSSVVLTDTSPTYDILIDTPNVQLTTSEGDSVTFHNGEPELQISVLPRFGWSSFSQSTPKVVTVTAVSTVLLNLNVKRQYASITNNSSQLIYIQKGLAAVYGRGYPLPPNGTYECILNEDGFLGQLSAIAKAGFVTVDVVEGVK